MYKINLLDYLLRTFNFLDIIYRVLYNITKNATFSSYICRLKNDSSSITEAPTSEMENVTIFCFSSYNFHKIES